MVNIKYNAQRLEFGGATVSLAFRVSESQKKLINDVLNTIHEETGKNKSDSFVHLINEYITLSSNSDADVSTSIKLVLKEIKDKGCGYLRHRDIGFICLALAHKSKSEKVLGVNPKEVKDLCLACLNRQKEIEQDRIKKEMQKASIKKLSDFAKIFKKIIGEGVLKDLYFCFHNIFDDDANIIFSTNGKTMKCPFKGNAIVLIKEQCEKMVNPDTEKPPCKYFVPLDYIVNITDEELKQAGLIIPDLELEYEEELEEESDTPKQIEVETKIIVEEDDG